MRRLILTLNPEQNTFLFNALHDETAVGSNAQSHESVIHEMFEKVYKGAATDFVMQFWNSDGMELDDKWLELLCSMTDMTSELISFIDDHLSSKAHHNLNNRKRKRESTDKQEIAKSSKRRRKSSLIF